jgi:hypothetical protein
LNGSLAVNGVLDNRERYAVAETRARANHLAGRRRMFNPYSAAAMAGIDLTELFKEQ